MKKNNSINIDFLKILLDLKNKQTNPFQIFKNKEINNMGYDLEVLLQNILHLH